MTAAVPHMEVSVRKETHCRFAEFLKIIGGLLMCSDSVPCGQVSRGLMFIVCGALPLPLRLVAGVVRDSGSF